MEKEQKTNCQEILIETIKNLETQGKKIKKFSFTLETYIPNCIHLKSNETITMDFVL